MFTLHHTDQQTKARAGVVHTDHGDIPTPIFMPVGTQGAVKAIDHRSLVELDAKIILGNTYHLYLRPGTEVLNTMGGLHRFMNWDRPILTDSGGFQVYSLREIRKMSDTGVEFRSHLDGSKHLFTPERVVDMQRAIGSDIMMVLDECTGNPATYEQARSSMELTLRWADRAIERFRTTQPLYGHQQFHFGIGQGSTYADLRKICMEELVQKQFDGYAIGGLAVGEPAESMLEMIEVSTEVMPANKARYLMGVGTPENILTAIERGVDMFDCVMPTRNARNGTLFTTKGRVNIKNTRYKLSEEPIDDGLDCYASQNFSLAYLRHLFVSGEILGLQLATMQNLALYLWLTRTAREKILEGTFRQWAGETIAQLNAPRL
ncbi:MAG: tRNA guanosine(34) transglycosylase Tgt [Bacteroidetes bacterium]|nr:tRNA guanosine(34) transglycosylase Tgt [Bacteroidota bacterium]